MANRRTRAGLSLEIDGLDDTLKAFGALESDLRKQANAELRAAARDCANVLAVDLARAAAASGVPVATLVARTIKVKSDRKPVVSIGGPTRVGTGGDRAPAARLLWGSEQGPKSDPNHFAVAPNPAGYWIAPTTARFQDDKAVELYKRGVYETMREHGLV